MNKKIMAVMLGRALLTIDAFLLLVGAPMADYGPTHMKNPNWPPHAKFHNGQTINLSLILGVATLFLTWRRSSLPSFTDTSSSSSSARDKEAVAKLLLLQKQNMKMAAFTGSIYWIAGLAAILYPGTMGLDPEFGGPGFPQAPLFAFAAACGIVGSWLVGKGLGEDGTGKGE
ncbi:hypothetical protein F5Y17DRAFT_451089 [Xylariaceae sp. FL0594]|nr:hypothetical protein F5Y17DRAFT_451089 [Xylariaceae sp. FL0594]